MRRRFKLLLIFCLLFFLSFNVKAEGLTSDAYGPYYISSYDVDMVVNRDNSFDITEKISVYFNEPRHGIFRKIPLSNEVKRSDGTGYTNHARVSMVSVDSKYSTSSENGQYVIKIGSASETVTGPMSYTIKYHYQILGYDQIDSYDELYFNLIGTEWDTSISNVSFRITMPKEFDKEKLGFSYGSFGSTLTSDLHYDVNGNVITGTLDYKLNSYEGLSVRCELDEGYFDQIKSSVNFIAYLLYSIPFVCVAISLYIYSKFRSTDYVVETVEFYPPEGLNSLDVGYIYNGQSSSKDVVSLLIYLANKGYVKITETEEKKLFGKKKGFIITKLKDYDGSDSNEEKFLKGLFKRGKEVDGYIQVTNSDLEDRFYTTIGSIVMNKNSDKNRYQIYDKNSLKKKKYIILMAIISFLAITVWPLYSYGDDELLILGLLFPSIAFSFSIGLAANYLNMPDKAKIFIKISYVFAIIMSSLSCLIILPALKIEKFYLVLFPIGLLFIIIMITILFALNKRTEYGTQILGKVKGFRNFLETAEKEKLEALVMDDPTYFYNILPYTYVFGISKKWIKKFESIAVEPPTWYYGTTGFDIVSFSDSFESTMSSVSSSFTSSPSSSSDGGFSGGGFSGGGSGGGGGGSW